MGKVATLKLTGKDLKLLQEAIEELRLSGWQSGNFTMDKDRGGTEIYTYTLKKVEK